jgi:hypothetical protein
MAAARRAIRQRAPMAYRIILRAIVLLALVATFFVGT